MSSADVLGVHAELIAARRAVSIAADKLRSIEAEALRLAPLIERGEIARGEAAACLIEVATAYGLCATERGREGVEHVVGMGLAGQSPGVGYTSTEVAKPASLTWTPVLRPLNLAEFLKLQLPPRRLILSPWLREKAAAMIYSPRGMGKTLLGLGVAYAAASGDSFLGWTAAEARRVLFVDGEMTAIEMQHRLAAIVQGFTREAAPDYFRMLSADLTERGLPDLATAEGQRELDDGIGDAELVVLDNISTLCRSGKENEAEGWQSFQDWALAHRRAGRSIVFKHHAGKGGSQRGTSKREDVLDTVIALRQPRDYRPNEGARFEVHFEKHRGFQGADAERFEARYEERDGAAVWTRTAIADVELKCVADAMRDDMSIREAAAELGMNKSKVERLRKKAKQLARRVLERDNAPDRERDGSSREALADILTVRQTGSVPLVPSVPLSAQSITIIPIAPGEPSLEQPCATRRGRVQEVGGAFLHFCCVCGAFGAFGYGVRLRAGQLGRWYCGEHRPQSASTNGADL